MPDLSPPADAPAILALDLGTSGTSGALIGADGGRLAAASSPFPTRVLPRGGAEQDPADWVSSAREVIENCLDGDRPVPSALALTGQMQDLILLGEVEGQRRALAPAVLYSDTRAGREASAIRAEVAQWETLTGAEQGPTSVAAMARRVRAENPEAFAGAEAIALGPAGFLAWLLTGEAWCDITTASTTGLLDREQRAWSEPVLEAAGLRAEMMPRLADGPGHGSVIGRTGADARELLGLPAGVPIVLAPGDAAATTLGIVGLEAGESYAYLGSSGWVAQVEHAAPHGSLAEGPAVHRLALPVDEEGADSVRARPELVIAPLLAAGGAAAWARRAFLDGVGPEEADAQLTAREATRERGPSGLLALPSLHGERYPVREPDLRAAVIGMDASTDAIDLYAAVLEAVAHAIAHALPAGGVETLPVCGGGARSLPWRRILADVTGAEIVAVNDAETAVLGAAIAGAEAVGLEHRILPLRNRHGLLSTPPDAEAHAAYVKDRAAQRSLYDAVAEVLRARE